MELNRDGNYLFSGFAGASLLDDLRNRKRRGGRVCYTQVLNALAGSVVLREQRSGQRQAAG